MHLLFVSETFPDADDPARGSYNVALCRALTVRHRVTAIAPRAWQDMLRRRLRVRRYSASPAAEAAGIDCRFPTFWYTPGMRHAQHGAAMWRSIERTVRSVHTAQQVDAVLSYWAHPDGEAGLLAARLLGVPHAVIVGGSDVLLLPQRADRRRAVCNVLNNSDAVITVSEGLRTAAIQLGVDPFHVHTIYQGIDADRFHPGLRAAARRRLGLPAERPVLLWVGRMVEVKRLDVLIAASRELQARGVDFMLCLAGDGPQRAGIEQLVRQHGLVDHVRFIGSVRHEHLAEWYRAADATVLSSRSEGLPNVLRESLACGTPFAATDVGSISEIADRTWSRLSRPNDPHALADAMSGVLSAECRAGAARYRARTWTACAADVGRLLEDLRQGTPGHSVVPQPAADALSFLDVRADALLTADSDAPSCVAAGIS